MSTTKKKKIKSKVVHSEEDPEDIFDIIQPLGEGAYASVYKALDKRNGELVALKIMKMNDDDMGDIEDEVRVMSVCKSKHIVKFHGSWIKDNNLWLAIEYCGAGSILDIIKVNGTLNEDEICCIMKDALKGLWFLHTRKPKLLHRDIKAANLLINHNGSCKLADFGVSRSIGTMDQANTVIGTPNWMAPEVIKDNKYGTKADIWSLGITAIEMALGRPPHSDKAPLQVLFLIPKSDPPNLPIDDDRWSDNFRDFISLCLTKDPQNRPGARDLIHSKFIKNCKGTRITQKLVIKVQPLIDEARKKKRELDEQSDNQNNKNNTDDDDDDDDDEYQGGTMLGPYDGSDNDFNGSTMIGPGNTNKNNDDDSDDDSQDNYGTMLISKNGKNNNESKEIESDAESEIEDIMIWESVFKNNEYINKQLPIPDDVTKEELQDIWQRIKIVSKQDKDNFENWYKKQIQIVEDKLSEIDK